MNGVYLMAKTFKAALAATFMAGAVAIAAPANAAIVIDYVDGASVAEAGYIVINQFNNTPASPVRAI